MKRHLPTILTVAVLALVFLAGYGAMYVADAQGREDVPAPGPAVSMLFDAGTDATTTPATNYSKISIKPPTLADPTQDTDGYARDVQSAFKAGRWVLLVVLGLFGLSRALLAAAAKWPRVAWLKTAAPYLVTTAAALGAIGASLSAGGAVDWNAVFGALGATGALYLTPHPKV